MPGKFCVSLTHAKDNTDKATVGFVIANAAVASDKETIVFLSTEGVRLASPGYADGIHEDGFAPLKDLMANFAKDQADLFGIPNDRNYYFQRLDARRVSFSRGRNLNLVPKQWGDALPFFVKGYVESDGKEHKGWVRTLTYTETKG